MLEEHRHLLCRGPPVASAATGKTTGGRKPHPTSGITGRAAPNSPWSPDQNEAEETPTKSRPTQGKGKQTSSKLHRRRWSIFQTGEELNSPEKPQQRRRHSGKDYLRRHRRRQGKPRRRKKPNYPIQVRAVIPGPPSSLALDPPLERKGASGITAGRRLHLGVALVSPATVAKG